MYGVIYLIIDGTNDMEYVGQTTRPVEERFKEHMKSDFYIGGAIRAHGAENFAIAVLTKMWQSSWKSSVNQSNISFIATMREIVPKFLKIIAITVRSKF